jgi:hypothetical protein
MVGWNQCCLHGQTRGGYSLGRPTLLQTEGLMARCIWISHCLCYRYATKLLYYLLLAAGAALWYSAGLRPGRPRVRAPIPVLGPTKPPIQRGPWPLSLGVKRPGREADLSSPYSTEVKECVELYLHSPSTPSWRGAQLKHRDNFTFTFLLFASYGF